MCNMLFNILFLLPSLNYLPSSPFPCLSVCVSLLVSHLSFYLLLQWKELWVECLIPQQLEIMSPDDWHSLNWPPFSCCILCQSPVRQKASFIWADCNNYLCMLLSVHLSLCLCDPCCRDHIHQAIFCFLSASPLSLCLISLASIPFFACELKAVTPYRRGFFCGDSSITYPYIEREAIPDSLLIAGGIAITGLTVRQWYLS